MAHEDRTPPSAVDLLATLRENPHPWDFFQAVRCADCASGGRPRTGESKRPSDEFLRLAQEPHVTFAPSNLARFETDPHNSMVRLVQRSFGLLGPNGPLPLHLTEYARDRIRDHNDDTFVRFLDLFHHRMLSFFYRAWAMARPTVSYDRPEADRFGTYVASLIGLGMKSLRGRDPLEDVFKLHAAGRLACQTKNAEGLEAMIVEYFRSPARVVEFVGQWVQLPENCRCYLGVDPRSCTIGESVTVGSHVWDCQLKFRVILGPVDLQTYGRFLPGRESLCRIVALVRNYIGDELTWDLQLILEREQIPQVQLGIQGYLGWTDWLVSETPAADAADLVLEGEC